DRQRCTLQHVIPLYKVHPFFTICIIYYITNPKFRLGTRNGVGARVLSLLLQLCQNGRSLISARGTELCRLYSSVPLALISDRPF
ncbi:hypothetical protein SFRURICE_007407, partial [Spodoptera frugiperda]